MVAINVRTRIYINLVPGRYMVDMQKVGCVALTTAIVIVVTIVILKKPSQ